MRRVVLSETRSLGLKIGAGLAVVISCFVNRAGPYALLVDSTDSPCHALFEEIGN